MRSLFFDTSYGMTTGIFNENYEWIDFQSDLNPRSSNQIQKKINEMLVKNKISIESLEGFVHCSGPGSYTGLRVSNGMAEFIKMEVKRPVYSFYHHEMAKWISPKCIFISKAFKGEYFLYDGYQGEKAHFIREAELVEILEKKGKDQEIYTSYRQGLDQFIIDHFKDQIIETYSLFQRDKKILKSIIKEKMVRPLFYYRSIDQEFKRPGKKD